MLLDIKNVAENKRITIIIENAIKFANTDAGPITKILKIILHNNARTRVVTEKDALGKKGV